MNKGGKTGYDVQKNLSGLMLSSQSSANSRKPFVPPGQKRRTDEESLDDDSIFNMYTALKARPRPLSCHAPTAHFKGRETGAGSGHGIKRSKFKNPFKVSGHEVKSQDKVEISRYVRQGVLDNLQWAIYRTYASAWKRMFLILAVFKIFM